MKQLSHFGFFFSSLNSTNAKENEALMNLGTGEDTLLFVNGDTVIGGEGNDSITPAAFNEDRPNVLAFLFGGEGDDVINAGPEPDEIRPGSGANTIGGDLSNDTLITEGGDDNVLGTPAFQIP